MCTKQRSPSVLDVAGKLVMEAILETKAVTILQFVHGLRGSLHVTYEEGTWAAWLHDLQFWAYIGWRTERGNRRVDPLLEMGAGSQRSV